MKLMPVSAVPIRFWEYRNRQREWMIKFLSISQELCGTEINEESVYKRVCLMRFDPLRFGFGEVFCIM